MSVKKWKRMQRSSVVVALVALILAQATPLVYAESSSSSQAAEVATSQSLPLTSDETSSSSATLESPTEPSSLTSASITNERSSSSSDVDLSTENEVTEPSVTVSSAPTEESGTTVSEGAKTQPALSERLTTESSISPESQTETITLHRLYNPQRKVYLYTKNEVEYKGLTSKGWNYEGVAWQSSANQGEIVYRLYNPQRKAYLYTKNVEEYTKLPQKGWNKEGVAFRSYGGMPVYRLYNAQLKQHFYTRHLSEYTKLQQQGWSAEGVAFYGLGTSVTTPAPTKQNHIFLSYSHTYHDGSVHPEKQTGNLRLYSASDAIPSFKREGYRVKSVTLTLFGVEGGNFMPVASYDQQAPQDGTMSYELLESLDKRDVHANTYFDWFVEWEKIPTASIDIRTPVMLAWERGVSEWTVETAKDNIFNNNNSFINGTIFSDKGTIPTFNPAGYRVKSVQLRLHAKINGVWQNDVKDYSDQAPKDGSLSWELLERLNKEVSYEYSYFNWKVVWEKIPQTTPSTTVTKTQRREPVGYKTIRQANSTMWEDEEVVTRNGEDGYKLIEVTTTKNNLTGQTTTTEQVIDSKPAVDKIITYGTKRLYTTTTTNQTEVIHYKSERVNDPNLEQGKTQVRVIGVNGSRTVAVTTTTNNRTGAQTTNRTVLSETPATNEVVAVGTKPVITPPSTTVTKTQRREPVGYKTIRQANSTMWEDEEVVTRNGEDGYKLIEVTTTKNNLTGQTTTTEQVIDSKPAVDKIITYGTKRLYTTTTTNQTEVIQYKSETVDDPNLEQGKTQVRVVGVNGSRTVVVTTTVDNRTGEQTVRREVTSETPATNEVVAVGTKQVVTTPAPKDRVTLDEFLAMSEEEQDAHVARGGKLSGMGQYYTQAQADKAETVINLDKLNRELLSLINSERTKAGLTEMTYAGVDSTLQQTVSLRANEMADYGSLRYQNLESGAHKRPDGSEWTTAASPEHAEKVIWQGENTLQYGVATNVLTLSNERQIASSMFRSWMNSSGHRSLIMSKRKDLQVAFAVALGARTYGSTVDNDGLTIGVMQVAWLSE